MRKILFILCAIFALFVNPVLGSNEFIGKASLSGKITDNKSGVSLTGVSVYFPDLKIGTSTHSDGTYFLDNLPENRVLIQITFLGYKPIVEFIDLTHTKIKDFSLEESVTELNEVVVTGLSAAASSSRIPTPISIISPLQLELSSSGNIIDAISKHPGISQITTGPGISKPVIRGLGFNRIVTLNDGIRQEGQQWGDEHGIEVDEFSVHRVEILKGPSSLVYGSDALAGVINFISSPTLTDGTVAGKLLFGYSTNNGLMATSLNIAGNRKGLIWNIRYSGKQAHSYKNKYDGYVFNSGFNESAFTAIAGLNKSWGYSHLHFSLYKIEPGIVEGERDSVSGNFVKPVITSNGNIGSAIAAEHDFLKYMPQTPYQMVRHSKVVLNNSFILGGSTLKATFGWQQNHRQEYGDILHPSEYGLYFFLNTFNYDFRFIFPEKNNWNISVGTNGMNQISQNKGSEYLIPEYSLLDAGLFAVARKSYEKLELSGGLRYDVRYEKGKALYLNSEGNPVSNATLSDYQKFSAFNTTYSAFSGSLGATYLFSPVFTVKMNVARGFRAPNISEIGSNGIHEGTIRYEIGDPELKSEYSGQIDLSFDYNSKHVSGSLNLFANNISNYIFLHKLQSISGNDSITEGYSTFRFSAGDANLLGGEFMFDIHPHPLDWLHIENSFAYVYAAQTDQPDSTKYLPMTPAPKFSSDIKATSGGIGNHIKNSFIEIGLEYYFPQNKIYSAYATETPTPGFMLLNLRVGTDITHKNKTLMSFYLSLNNVLDVASQSHLSRLKYAPENYATGRFGVYDMGRNLCFKLIVPIGFSIDKNK